MRASTGLSAIGIWLAGLAIGVKVILGAFAAAPLSAGNETAYAGFGWQSICAGSGFDALDGEKTGNGAALTLTFCPWCLVGGAALPALDPPTLSGLLFFALLLAFPIGVDHLRREGPPPVGFASRAPPSVA